MQSNEPTPSPLVLPSSGLMKSNRGFLSGFGPGFNIAISKSSQKLDHSHVPANNLQIPAHCKNICNSLPLLCFFWTNERRVYLGETAANYLRINHRRISSLLPPYSGVNQSLIFDRENIEDRY